MRAGRSFRASASLFHVKPRAWRRLGSLSPATASDGHPAARHSLLELLRRPGFTFDRATALAIRQRCFARGTSRRGGPRLRRPGDRADRDRHALCRLRRQATRRRRARIALRIDRDPGRFRLRARSGRCRSRRARSWRRIARRASAAAARLPGMTPGGVVAAAGPRQEASAQRDGRRRGPVLARRRLIAAARPPPSTDAELAAIAQRTARRSLGCR